MKGVPDRSGRRFEEAVFRFAQALDPTAEVLFDHKVPDRDTGKPRQCDAWINAKYGGHWPLAIYVSCKDRSKSKRNLDQGDVDAFMGEVRARGATMGVLYTNTGFTGPAIDKARLNHVPCCRLYVNEPADIPQALWIKQFVCKPSVALSVSEKPRQWPLVTWSDVFGIEIETDTTKRTVLEAVVGDFLVSEQNAVVAVKQRGGLPKDWANPCELGNEGWRGRLAFTISGHWKAYVACIAGTLLAGSYSFNDGRFRGSVEGPWIDTQGVHPGPHWQETDPSGVASEANPMVLVLYHADVASALRSAFGHSTVESGPQTPGSEPVDPAASIPST